MSKQETIRQMPSRRVVVLVLVAMVALASLLVALAARPAHASTGTLVVNPNADFFDRTPGDGVCDADAAIGNLCTLRAAIEEANASSGLDVIAFNIPGSRGAHHPAGRAPGNTRSGDHRGLQPARSLPQYPAARQQRGAQHRTGREPNGVLSRRVGYRGR